MKKILAFYVIGVVAVTSTASAQRSSQNGGPVELGVDAGLTVGLDDPNTTLVAIPVQDFRLGYFVTNTFEIEPRFHLMSVHVDGAGTLTTYALEIGALLLPGGDRAGRGVYFRPFGGFTGISASAGGSDSNGFLGGGIGLKIPFADRRLATRMEANYAHGFGNSGTNQIGLLLGLSFFTH